MRCQAASLAVTVEGPGTGDGFATFCTGGADIADASRPINEEEIAQCEENGVEYVELEVAIDGLTVATNPANEAITCLDVPALYALVGPESEGFANWSDATELATEVSSAYAADFPEAPLDISGPGEESGTYDTFVEFAIADLAEERGQDEATRADYSSSPNDNLIVEGIEASESSLGWVGFAYYAAEQERMKASRSTRGRLRRPDARDDRRWLVPVLPQPLHLRQHGQCRVEPGRGLVRRPVPLPEGLASVADAGYVDLPEDRVQAAHGRLGRPLSPALRLEVRPPGAGHEPGAIEHVMLTVQDLRGSAKQRRRERTMRVVFQAAAVVSILISLLILFVLLRGAINFMRAIDWDFGLLSDTGWFPRRERFDVRTIVVGSVVMGFVAMLVAVPFGLGTADLPVGVRAADECARSSSRSSRSWPGSRRSSSGSSSSTSLLPSSSTRSSPSPRVRRPCSPPASASGSSSSRSWQRCRRTPSAQCPTPCARPATAAVPASSTPCSRSSFPPPSPASWPRSIIAVSRAIGETMVATMAAGYDGSGPTTGSAR